MTSPPNSRMPTSNETRVRGEDLAKSMAQTCPARGLWLWLARSRFNRAAWARIAWMSATGRVRMLKRCFMVKGKGIGRLGTAPNRPNKSGSQIGHHRLEDLQGQFRLARTQIQRRQETH